MRTRLFLAICFLASLLAFPTRRVSAYYCDAYNYTISATGSVDVFNGEAVAEPGTTATLRIVNLITRQYTNYALTVPALAAGTGAHLLDVTVPASGKWTITPVTRNGGCGDSGGF